MHSIKLLAVVNMKMLNKVVETSQTFGILLDMKGDKLDSISLRGSGYSLQGLLAMGKSAHL
jgi:hypothetical protein